MKVCGQIKVGKTLELYLGCLSPQGRRKCQRSMDLGVIRWAHMWAGKPAHAEHAGRSAHAQYRERSQQPLAWVVCKVQSAELCGLSLNI